MSGDSILSFLMFIKCLIMQYANFNVLFNTSNMLHRNSFVEKDSKQKKSEFSRRIQESNQKMESYCMFFDGFRGGVELNWFV